MKTRSKLVRLAVLALSLALLAAYVIYAQSKSRTAKQEASEEFMLPSSKALTRPVFVTRETETTAADEKTAEPAVQAPSDPFAPRP
ncbi:hypothetical protein [Prosthecobacter sp.]|uniref:hypothetical protein n=1 Tax=Prosthecobacter sp. TaxID=1965333 RepID=UPI0037848510